MFGGKHVKQLCALTQLGVLGHDFAIETCNLPVVCERIVESGCFRLASAHPFVAVELSGLQDFGNQVDIVLGNHAAGVAGLIRYTGALD